MDLNRLKTILNCNINFFTSNYIWEFYTQSIYYGYKNSLSAGDSWTTMAQGQTFLKDSTLNIIVNSWSSSQKHQWCKFVFTIQWC